LLFGNRRAGGNGRRDGTAEQVLWNRLFGQNEDWIILR
jgi:hypothetical protein